MFPCLPQKNAFGIGRKYTTDIECFHGSTYYNDRTVFFIVVLPFSFSAWH